MIPTHFGPHTGYLQLRSRLPLSAQNAGLFVSNGTGIHPRRVLDSFVLIFLIKGTLQMRENEERFNLDPGQALLLWPRREHAGTEPYGPLCSYYWIVFDVAETDAHTSCTIHIPQLVTVSRPDHLTTLFRRFLDDQETKFLQPAAADCLTTLMLCELTVAQAHENRNQASVLARDALRYIVAHFALPLSTSRIAAELGCSADYLGRCFQSVYGFTITEAIHRQRLKIARSMLLDTTDTIEIIACQCGFTNAIFFRRIFKRYEGIPPSTFRELYARVHFNSR